jgi:hypothetical protein
MVIGKNSIILVEQLQIHPFLLSDMVEGSSVMKLLAAHFLCVTYSTQTHFSLKMTVFWDVVLCSLAEITNISELLTASIIRAMSNPRAIKWVKIQEQVGQGRSLARPMGKEGGLW